MTQSVDDIFAALIKAGDKVARGANEGRSRKTEPLETEDAIPSISTWPVVLLEVMLDEVSCFHCNYAASKFVQAARVFVTRKHPTTRTRITMQTTYNELQNLRQEFPTATYSRRVSSHLTPFCPHCAPQEFNDLTLTSATRVRAHLPVIACDPSPTPHRFSGVHDAPSSSSDGLHAGQGLAGRGSNGPGGCSIG